MYILHQRRQFAMMDGFEVGNEISRPGHIQLGLRVESRVNSVIRTLKQTILAVLHQLDTVVFAICRATTTDTFGRHHHGSSDIVFHLHFFCCDIVLS